MQLREVHGDFDCAWKVLTVSSELSTLVLQPSQDGPQPNVPLKPCFHACSHLHEASMFVGKPRAQRFLGTVRLHLLLRTCTPHGYESVQTSDPTGGAWPPAARTKCMNETMPRLREGLQQPNRRQETTHEYKIEEDPLSLKAHHHDVSCSMFYCASYLLGTWWGRGR